MLFLGKIIFGDEIIEEKHYISLPINAETKKTSLSSSLRAVKHSSNLQKIERRATLDDNKKSISVSIVNYDVKLGG